MVALSNQQLWSLSLRAFGPELAPVMFGIAKAESGGDTGAWNNQGEDSRGLWQINIDPRANPDLAHYDLSDPEQNAQAASIVLNRQGLRAWTTFSGGHWRQYAPRPTSTRGPVMADKKDVDSALTQAQRMGYKGDAQAGRKALNAAIDAGMNPQAAASILATAGAEVLAQGAQQQASTLAQSGASQSRSPRGPGVLAPDQQQSPRGFTEGAYFDDQGALHIPEAEGRGVLTPEEHARRFPGQGQGAVDTAAQFQDQFPHLTYVGYDDETDEIIARDMEGTTARFAQIGDTFVQSETEAPGRGGSYSTFTDPATGQVYTFDSGSGEFGETPFADPGGGTTYGFTQFGGDLYRYDSNGNLVLAQAGADDPSYGFTPFNGDLYRYDDQGNLVRAAEGDPSYGFTPFDGDLYRYDDQGNLVRAAEGRPSYGFTPFGDQLLRHDDRGNVSAVPGITRPEGQQFQQFGGSVFQTGDRGTFENIHDIPGFMTDEAKEEGVNNRFFSGLDEQTAQRRSDATFKQANFTRDVLSNPSDFLARAFFQRGGESPLPRVTHADLINQLGNDLGQVDPGFYSNAPTPRPQASPAQAPRPAASAAPQAPPTALGTPVHEPAPSNDGFTIPHSAAPDQLADFGRRARQMGVGVPGFAGGGFTQEPMFRVGDAVPMAEETVINPTGAPIAVVPTGKMGVRPQAPGFQAGTGLQSAVDQYAAKGPGLTPVSFNDLGLFDQLRVQGFDTQGALGQLAARGYDPTPADPSMARHLEQGMSWDQGAQALGDSPSRGGQSGAGGFQPVSQQDLISDVQKFSPPAVNDMFSNRKPKSQRFGFSLFTPEQLGSLTPDEGAALNTRLGVEHNTTLGDVEHSVNRRFGFSRSTPRARSSVGFAA